MSQCYKISTKMKHRRTKHLVTKYLNGHCHVSLLAFRFQSGSVSLEWPRWPHALLRLGIYGCLKPWLGFSYPFQAVRLEFCSMLCVSQVSDVTGLTWRFRPVVDLSHDLSTMFLSITEQMQLYASYCSKLANHYDNKSCVSPLSPCLIDS